MQYGAQYTVRWDSTAQPGASREPIPIPAAYQFLNMIWAVWQYIL